MCRKALPPLLCRDIKLKAYVEAWIVEANPAETGGELLTARQQCLRVQKRLRQLPAG